MAATSLDQVLDEFSGMISRAQAKSILDSQGVTPKLDQSTAHSSNFSVKEILERYQNFSETLSTFNIEDTIYRIFNESTYDVAGKRNTKRIIILGKEGDTIKVNLYGKLADYIDLNGFEAGDIVIITNLIFDSSGNARNSPNTYISKIRPGGSAITNYSEIKSEMRNINIIGKVIEIDPIRYITRIDKQSQVPTCRIKLSDLLHEISVSLWESSALSTVNMHINDYVKIEFCASKVRNDTIEIYANNYSRVLISKALSNRLIK
ncbi:MAG: hypothetical protein ACP5RP_00615 [Candidatus Micrarchaeia archaeon]